MISLVNLSCRMKQPMIQGLRSLVKKPRGSELPPRDEYQAVPQYKQMSAIYQKLANPNEKARMEDIFPRIITAELSLASLFLLGGGGGEGDMEKSALNLNLLARHIHLNLNKLRQDYVRMRALEAEIDRFEAEKRVFTDKISSLIKQKGGIKTKKTTLESEEARDLLQAGNDIKSKENKILEELSPLAEIVNVACLRLPNSLHYSTLLLDTISSTATDFDRFRHTLFSMNMSQLDTIKRKMRRDEFDHGFDWRTLLDDSVELERGVRIRAKYCHAAADNDDKASNENSQPKWSFVKESSIESIQNNPYLVGTYAKIEQAIVDFVLDKINKLNDHSSSDANRGVNMPNFEHVKSVSMFKSAIVEGCGENFTNTKHIFNVVRFSGPPLTSATSGAATGPASDVELWHLTGACSLNSLVLGFVHTSIKSTYLPWTVYTQGKAYAPDSGQSNCIDLLTLTSADSSSEFMMHNDRPIGSIDEILGRGQAYLDELKAQVESFALRCEHSLYEEELRRELAHTSTPSKSIDQIFIDYLKLFVYVFKDFDIPIRFLCLNANQLKSSESFLVQVQAYLPSSQAFVTIGEVSLLNDYLSSRLQIRCIPSGNKSKPEANEKQQQQQIKHVNMIYCRLIDINVFTQLLIETNIIKNYSGRELNKKVSFVLPNPLKPFYHV